MWKTKLFKNNKDALDFILKNHNKKGFRYEHVYNGEFFSVTYRWFK